MKNNFHSWKNGTSPFSIIHMPTVHLCKGRAFDSQKLDSKWSTFTLNFQAILTERLDDLQYDGDDRQTALGWNPGNIML